MDSLLSFPVGLFHPLQHAGLSRRTRLTDYPTSENVANLVFAKALEKIVDQDWKFLIG
jgi:hypothetical protein